MSKPDATAKTAKAKADAPPRAAKAQDVDVRFLQRDAPWGQGEMAAFPPAVAARLVESGVACPPEEYAARLKAQQEGRDGR